MHTTIHNSIRRLEVVVDVAARRLFAVAARRALPVDFDDEASVSQYRASQVWCSENCTGRWSAASERLRGRAEFSFENDVDAVFFALRWADSTAPQP